MVVLTFERDNGLTTSIAVYDTVSFAVQGGLNFQAQFESYLGVISCGTILMLYRAVLTFHTGQNPVV